MEATILFAISVITSLIVWNKIGREYFWHRLQELELKRAVQPILILHTFRFAGLSFLIPGVVHAGLNPAWALPAAFGDFAAAILALIALLMINSASFRPFLWVFNILGLIDLIVAFIDGPRYNILPFLGAGYYIIILYVPLLLLTHLRVFKLLLKSKTLQLAK
ncbi:MAG: hypothetical protein JST50_19075 [Bacteroidetes bacterium]|jgi:hypothetical protein|nr:hypothetical protein [Bacteroidota bacterium]